MGFIACLWMSPTEAEYCAEKHSAARMIGPNGRSSRVVTLIRKLRPREIPRSRLAFCRTRRQTPRRDAIHPEPARAPNLAGLMIEGVTFHAAVTDAIATVIRKTSEDPPAYLVELLFSFKGLQQIEVPEARIRPV